MTDIDNITIGQAREIAKQFTSPTCSTATKLDIPNGETNIVIVDRGFVWVGKTTVSGDFCKIEDCRNIRIWGTTKGIGELRGGPLSSTKLDDCGTVIVPMRAVIAFVKCTRNW